MKEVFRLNAGLDDKSWVVFVRTYSIVLALILAVTAFLSLGYYHPDEHFQTIEFASYKLGKTAASDLAWEFGQRIRPWLQPACYVVIAKTAALLGIADLFILALIFRLFSAFFAWLSISAMMFCAYRLFHEQSQRKAAVRLLALFCFLPYYMVRTSSESLSTSFCMMGFALLIMGSRALKQDASCYERTYPGALCFVTGILWGLAFEFRYQVAFLIMGFMFWMFFVSIRDKKTGFVKILLIVCGILAPVAGCTFLDSWGYGGFTVAPWNYLDQNIFQHKAAGFGTMPVWGYFKLIAKRPLFPALLTLGAAVGMWRFKKHPFTWGILVFFLIHSLIGHKEIRFLLNLTIPALFMVVYAVAPKKIDGGDNAAIPAKLWKLRGSLPAKFFYALNLVLLVVYSTRIEQPALFLDRYIYRHTAAPFHAYAVGEYPYSKSGSLLSIFYQPEGIAITECASLDKVLRDAEGKQEFFLTASNADTVSLPAYGPYQVEILYQYKQKNLWTIIEQVLENQPKFVWTLYRFAR
ncbi:MAG: hypothetical protein LBD48_01305 [Treponema sp.]|jgi:phosphatidylinositol glycan class B|nr:hypothetical protein [Treponema sp.]